MTERQKNKELYWAWKSMKQRCQNPNCKAYRNYGGRGIKVCNEWQQFDPFLEWALTHGHAKGLDLDRKDNNGNYSPDNCRWVTRRQNVNNRRNTVRITIDGVTLPDTVWAEKVGIDRALLKYWRKQHGNDYVVSRVKDILKNGYTEKDYGYSHRKKVRHVETGEIFQSGREAARHFGVGNSTIIRSMQRGVTTHIGTFEKVLD